MILVSVLGDFHSSIFPVFFEFKEKIKKHILLYDDSEYDLKQLSKILKGQEFFLSNYETQNGFNIDFEVLPIKVNEDSFQSIQKCYDEIMQNSMDPKEVFFNCTDGLTSIILVLTNQLLDIGANIIVYDRYANTYNLHTKQSMNKYKIEKIIDIKNHLKLKGYDLISFTNRFTLERRKPFILKITNNLPQFKIFANNYTRTDSTKGFYNELIQLIGENEEQFVKGGIFEEYIYWLIKDNIAVNNIMLGVTVQFDKDVNNEIDILIMIDNHLHTIECKFTDNFKTSEYLYKTDSIIDYIDDDGKGMILTVGNKNIGHQDLARARNNNIYFYAVEKFNEKDFIHKIKSWFNV